MTSEIIKAVKAMLETVCPSVYFGRSAAVYPKIVCDLRRLGEETQRRRYSLTLDYYTEGPQIGAIRLSEKVRSAIHKERVRTESGLFAVWQSGEGYFVSEKDGEKISHYADRYEITFFIGKEE